MFNSFITLFNTNYHFWLYKCIGVRIKCTHTLKSKLLFEGLHWLPWPTGKAWNEANLQSTSLYGCIHLVLCYFHQAEYSNIPYYVLFPLECAHWSLYRFPDALLHILRFCLHNNVLGLINKNERFLAVFVAFTWMALNAKRSLEIIITYC